MNKGITIDVATGESSEINSDPVVAAIEAQQAEARAFRDEALKECDWTQVSDVNLSNANEWITYRQSLRDVSLAVEWKSDPIGVVEQAISGKP